MLNLDLPTEIGSTLDVLIIGAGPAGMTAAVYSARKRLATGIVTKDVGGQVAWTLGIENYMGYQYITGRELTGKFEEQVRQYPVAIVTDEVVGVTKEGDLFAVTTSGGRAIRARAVIVASGKRPRELGVAEERRMIGRGLSYCATCDGPLFAGLDVAVVGGGNSAVQAAIEMSKIASKVYIVSRNPWRADPVLADRVDQLKNLERRIGYTVTGIVGESRVEGLRIRARDSGRDEVIAVRGVFVEIGLTPNSEFVRGLVELNQWAEIVVDCRCRTSLPGLFAAGDVTNVNDKQIVVAAGEGAKAALSAHEYLLGR